MANGMLVMLWSSMGDSGYAMGFARSDSGTISRLWKQEEVSLGKEEGGHGMIFQTSEGRLMMTFLSPNSTPDERPVFIAIEEAGDGFRIKS